MVSKEKPLRMLKYQRERTSLQYLKDKSEIKDTSYICDDEYLNNRKILLKTFVTNNLKLKKMNTLNNSDKTLIGNETDKMSIIPHHKLIKNKERIFKRNSFKDINNKPVLDKLTLNENVNSNNIKNNKFTQIKVYSSSKNVDKSSNLNLFDTPCGNIRRERFNRGQIQKGADKRFLLESKFPADINIFRPQLLTNRLAKANDINTEFPIINISEYPKETSDIRALLITLSLITNFFIIGSKLHLSENFDFASFCDLKPDWKEFDIAVAEKSIIMLEEKKCEDYCGFNGYVLSKVMQTEHLALATISYFLYFKMLNLHDKKYVKLFLILFPFGINLVKYFIFFKNKLVSYSINSFIIFLGSILLLLENKNIFMLGFGMTIPLIYLAVIKYFFENLFVYIFLLNPHLTRILLPILITGLKFILFKFILIYSPTQRQTPINKWVCLIPCCIFDFISIGNLHLIVEEELFTFSLFINLMYELAHDINLYFQIIPQLFIRLFNKITNKKWKFQISDFERIYISSSLDSDITTILLYFFLILLKYFNFSLSEITDCFGKPLVSKVVLNNNHYFLCFFLFVNFLLKIFFRKILKKYIFYNQQDYSHFPKFENKLHFMVYISYTYLVNSHFGYPGLYAMLPIK